MVAPSIIPDSNEFKGKRILVTGGTKGAGKAIAERFLRGGGIVVVTARSAPAENTGTHFIQADVSRLREPPRLSVRSFDVSTASISSFTTLVDHLHRVAASARVTDELWQQAIDENLLPQSGSIAACCPP